MARAGGRRVSFRMASATLRALRYLRSWQAGVHSADESEVHLDRGEDRVPATLFLPRGQRSGLPGWVVLHGITRPGRAHPGLLRFARALSHSGAAVLIPEVPEWRELRLSPDRALPTIRAAILALDARSETAPGRVGVVGFSFGAPQALVAAGDPAVRGHLAAAVAFGGYCDLPRTLDFLFTGRVEGYGVQEYIRPDPYGRWVVGANYLTAVPGMEDTADVAGALHTLAAAAGERRIESWDPEYDPFKASLRATLSPAHRELFDLFAPPSHREPDPDAVRELVESLARVAAERDPLLDPRPHLGRVEVAVHLVHGRQDHLIPFTETLRLRDALPPGRVRTTITRLFRHSDDAGLGSLLGTAREGLRFLGALRRILGDV